jgi:hypothetical protein
LSTWIDYFILHSTLLTGDNGNLGGKPLSSSYGLATRVLESRSFYHIDALAPDSEDENEVVTNSIIVATGKQGYEGKC